MLLRLEKESGNVSKDLSGKRQVVSAQNFSDVFCWALEEISHVSSKGRIARMALVLERGISETALLSFKKN